jgi:putative FmdB family regulatory protein
MPTYEYKCNSCHHKFEEFQSMADPPLVNCPHCKQPALERMVGSGIGLHFKGSGFYLTDYKKTNSSSTSTPSQKKEEKPSAEKKTAPDKT